MRLITWNVNSLKARWPRVPEVLEAHAPDVVCLQETKLSADAFPHAALAELGYRAVDSSEGRWNGVALLVRDGLEVSEPLDELPGNPVPEKARWVEATIDGVRVASVYVPNGREVANEWYPRKLEFLAAMRDRLETLVAAGPTVVAGDFNVAPEDQDVWDLAAFPEGSTHVTAPEREALAAFTELGLVDAQRAVKPEGEAFTWWDYRGGAFHRGHGLRIDLALVAGLTVTAVEVDRVARRNNEAGDKPSDHAPVIVDMARIGG
jgi:exodeoxyribonuclease III